MALWMPLWRGGTIDLVLPPICWRGDHHFEWHFISLTQPVCDRQAHWSCPLFLLVGEVAITLDDVMSLAQPVTSRPIDHVPSTFTKETVKGLLITCLGISIEEEAIVMTTASANVRLKWVAAYITGTSSQDYTCGLPQLIFWTWSTSRYLLASPWLTSTSPTSSTSATWMTATLGSHCTSVPIWPSLLSEPVHQQVGWRLHDISHGKLVII